jgi:hypothetical protein
MKSRLNEDNACCNLSYNVLFSCGSPWVSSSPNITGRTQAVDVRFEVLVRIQTVRRYIPKKGKFNKLRMFENRMPR